MARKANDNEIILQAGAAGRSIRDIARPVANWEEAKCVPPSFWL
jgi:hypothetical protein